MPQHLGKLAFRYTRAQGERNRLKVVQKVWQKIALWEDKHELWIVRSIGQKWNSKPDPKQENIKTTGTPSCQPLGKIKIKQMIWELAPHRAQVHSILVSEAVHPTSLRAYAVGEEMSTRSLISFVKLPIHVPGYLCFRQCCPFLIMV